MLAMSPWAGRRPRTTMQRMRRGRQAGILCILPMRYDASQVWRMAWAMKTTTMGRLGDDISRRRMQREFVARGLASRGEARRTGEYIDAAHVLAELERMLEAARATKAVD
ncbi:prevent-host-death protein [Burkholderia sp. Ac-20392]|uniref:prevent-host-death protein n=2 Tax=Burkholderiaceae TaxID=119060 RepID=UPI001F11AB6D|nr:prevent-host-death protein [Burkholderia sp. Ac-20392]